MSKVGFLLENVLKVFQNSDFPQTFLQIPQKWFLFQIWYSKYTCMCNGNFMHVEQILALCQNVAVMDNCYHLDIFISVYIHGLPGFRFGTGHMVHVKHILTVPK